MFVLGDRYGIAHLAYAKLLWVMNKQHQAINEIKKEISCVEEFLLHSTQTQKSKKKQLLDDSLFLNTTTHPMVFKNKEEPLKNRKAKSMLLLAKW